MASINFGIGFNVDKSGVEQVKRELAGIKKIIDENGKSSGLNEDLKQAQKNAQLLEQALNKATNNGLDKIDVKKFNNELKKSNTSLAKVYASLKNAGVDGSHAIKKLNRELNDTGIKAKESSKLLDSMFDTMGKTVKWGVSSSIMNSMVGQFQRAMGFTKALDESLNNIRVVTGKSAGEMKSFAKEANEAAKALGKTTTEYTDASLLYFQQGKSAEDVRELTKATMMAANITGTDVSDMADMITSALNGYSMAADKAIHVTDVLASVGAATGSDFQELAVGMSKVASQAATVGVPFEKLNAMLATITETTREAPETIGTSLKTVFARMSEIKVKGSVDDEDGASMSFGKVKDTLDLVGVALTDETGAMRDMGTVIEEIGAKWETFDTITKSAVTNALAGQRQASRLMALFNQWDRYEVALNEAMNASGTTLEQNKVRMESMSYKAAQMRAELEKLWMKALNSDMLKGIVDGFTGILEKVNALTESFGGMSTIVATLGGVLLSVFGKQFTGLLQKGKDGLSGITKQVKEWKTGESESNAPPDQVAKERKAKQGLSNDKFKVYQEKTAKVNSIDIDLDSNKKLIELQEQEIANGQKLIEQKNTRLDELESKVLKDHTNNVLLAQEKITKLEAERVKNQQSFEEVVADMTNAEAEFIGYSKKALIELGSFDEAFDQLSAADPFANPIANSKKFVEEINKTEKEVKDLEKTIDRAEAKKDKFSTENVVLENRRNVETADLDALDREAKVNRRIDLAVKSIGALTTAIPLAISAFKTFGDETLSTGEKLDSAGNSLIAFSGSLFMLGGPVGMIAGGLAILAGVVLKVSKNFGEYTKAVKANEEAVERYTQKTEELTDSINTLNQQQSSFKDMQEQVANVGGDLSKLTDEQRKSYQDLANQIAETTPELVAYYDAEGNAIIKANADFDKYIAKKKEALQLEREKMAGNRDNFVTEYSHDIQGNKEAIEEKKEDIAKKENSIKRMEDRGASTKSIDRKKNELETLKNELAELEGALDDLDAKIQSNIIDPFMQSTTVIQNADDSVKQVIASTYQLDDVQGIVDKYKTEWRINEATKELEQVPRDYKEMSKLVSADLKDLEEQAKNTTIALNKIRDKSTEGGEVGESYKKTWENLTKLDQAAQDYIGTMAKFGYSVESTEGIIKDLADNVNEFGLVKEANVGSILDDRIKNAEAQIAKTQQATEDLKQQKVDTKAEQDDWYSKSADFGSQEYAQKQSAITRLGEEEKRLGQEIQDNLQRETEQRVGIMELKRQSAAMEREASAEYQKYLFALSQTPEGMNKIIDSYNAQYQQLSSMVELMNSADPSAKQEEGAAPAEGEEGATPEQSTWGDAITEADNLIEQQEALDERIAILKEAGAEANQDMISSLMEQSVALAESSGEAIDKVGEKLKSLPEGVLDEFAKMDSSIQDNIDNIKKSSGKAAEADVKAVTQSIRKQTQALGKMYAVAQKDSTTYYKDFKKRNEDQMKVVALATGRSADEYATYAQYTADLDQWMADNASWLSDEQASSYYWAALQGINARKEQALKSSDISGDEVKMNEIDAKAKEDASKAAAQAAVIAEGKAFVEKQNIVIEGLQAIVNASGNDIFDAAARAAKRKLNELKNQVGIANSIVANAEAQLADLAGDGNGNTTKEERDKIKNSITTDKHEYGLGDGKVERVPTKKPGGPPPPSNLGGGNKGGDKGGSEKEKEVEDMEWEEDKYHDINNELERKSKLLDKLKAQQDKLYGKELLDNLAKQKTLLEQQQKLLERKLEMQKADAKAQADALRAQGVIINSSTGMIENYNQIIAARVAAANALSGEAKEAAIESANKFIEAMEKYEEMVNNTIFETQSAIQESIDAQREIFLQEFEYKINFQIELSDDFQKALGFQKEINDEFEDTSENIDRTSKQMVDTLEKVVNLEAQYNKVMNDASLTDKERIEMMSKLSEQLKEAIKDLKKLDEEMTKVFVDGLKKGQEEIQKQVKAYEDMNKEIKHMEQMMKLLGKGEDFGAILELQKAEYETITGRLGYLTKEREVLEKERKALEEAGMKGTKEWEAIDEAIKKTTTDIDKLTQDAIKNLQDQFKTAADEIMDSLDKGLTNGVGLDKIKKQMKERREDSKKYLDNQQKLLAITKLQSKIQKEIDSTDDPARKAKLQKFMDQELKRLREKDKLTKYDVDRANKLYEIAQKQMALDDLKNAKDTMRLVRDSQGNWVYEFTEDLDAIEKAKNDLSQSMEDLYESDKKHAEQVQDEMLKAYEDYSKEIMDINKNMIAGKYENEEAYHAALDEATKRFQDKMANMEYEYSEAKKWLAEDTIGVILQAYQQNGIDLDKLNEEQKQSLHALAEAVGGDFNALREFMDKLLNGDEESMKKAFEDLGISSEATMSGIEKFIKESIGASKEKWGLDIMDMLAKVDGESGLKEKTNGAIQAMKDKWAEYQKQVGEVTKLTGNDFDSMKDRIDAIKTATENLNSETDETIKKFKTEMDAVAQATIAFQKHREEIQKNIDKYGDLINKIDQAIKKKKEEASGITTSGGNGGSGSGGSGSGGSGGGSAPPPKPPTPPPTPAPSLTKGSQVRVKSGRTWYYDSYGKAPSGSTTPYANTALQITSVNNGGSKPYNVGKYPGNYLGWLTKDDIVGYDTGGYTGEWGKEGKMAFLHEKEIVLNKEDTKNILDTVKTVRGDKSSSSLVHITNAILETSIRTLDTLRNAVGSMMSTPTVQPRQEENMEQVVNINADFSGVRSADEIEKAFENMANMASQYIHRR